MKVISYQLPAQTFPGTHSPGWERARFEAVDRSRLYGSQHRVPYPHNQHATISQNASVLSVYGHRPALPARKEVPSQQVRAARYIAVESNPPSAPPRVGLGAPEFLPKAGNLLRLRAVRTRLQPRWR